MLAIGIRIFRPLRFRKKTISCVLCCGAARTRRIASTYARSTAREYAKAEARLADLAGRLPVSNHSGGAFAEKRADRGANFLSMRLQREVAGIVEMHLGVGVVAPEGLGPRRKKERIVLAPHRQ